MEFRYLFRDPLAFLTVSGSHYPLSGSSNFSVTVSGFRLFSYLFRDPLTFLTVSGFRLPLSGVSGLAFLTVSGSHYPVFRDPDYPLTGPTNFTYSYFSYS